MILLEHLEPYGGLPFPPEIWKITSHFSRPSTTSFALRLKAPRLSFPDAEDLNRAVYAKNPCIPCA